MNDLGVEEWDKAIKDSPIDLEADFLSKNLTLPQKPVEFDDMTKDVDDAFWLMLFSSLAPLTLENEEEHAKILFNFFLKLRTSKEFNIGDQKVNEILVEAEKCKKYVLSELLFYKMKLQERKKYFVGKNDLFLEWKREIEGKINGKLLEYSKHEDPYQILCVKVLLAEEIPKKLQTLCAVKIKSESSINHVEQGEQLTTICVEDEKKWNDLFVFNCNLQQPEKSDLTITLKVRNSGVGSQSGLLKIGVMKKAFPDIIWQQQNQDHAFSPFITSHELNWILNEISFRGLFSKVQTQLIRLEVLTQPLPSDIKRLKEACKILHELKKLDHDRWPSDEIAQEKKAKELIVIQLENLFSSCGTIVDKYTRIQFQELLKIYSYGTGDSKVKTRLLQFLTQSAINSYQHAKDSTATGSNEAIRIHRCVNAIDHQLEEFKKANDFFKDLFDIVQHAVIVFTQLLFPDLKKIYPPSRTNIPQDELESAMSLVIALEKLSLKLEANSLTPEKVRIPVMDWLATPINMWVKNSRSLLESWSARAIGLENWKSVNVTGEIHYSQSIIIFSKAINTNLDYMQKFEASKQENIINYSASVAKAIVHYCELLQEGTIAKLLDLSGTVKWSALEIEDAACIDFLSLPVEFQGRKLDKKKRAKIKDVCVSFCPSEEICIRLCNFLGIRKILQAFEAHLKELIPNHFEMVSQQFLKEPWQVRLKSVETVVEAATFEMKPDIENLLRWFSKADITYNQRSSVIFIYLDHQIMIFHQYCDTATFTKILKDIFSIILVQIEETFISLGKPKQEEYYYPRLSQDDLVENVKVLVDELIEWFHAGGDGITKGIMAKRTERIRELLKF